MGKLYNSYAEALAEDTECKFSLDFPFKLPEPQIPPTLPLPDFSWDIPSIPFYCALD